ncbi:MAG: hypothetical protein NVS3B20_16440 [Polyangiales bacterium]
MHKNPRRVFAHVRRALFLASVSCLSACETSTPIAPSSGDAQADLGTDAPAAHLVRGTVVDLEGAPVANIYVTVSTEFCIPDRTAPGGTFAVKNVLAGGSKRLILYGPTASGGPYASLAFAFSGADFADVAFAKPIVTPRLVSPLPFKKDVVESQRLTTADGFVITLRAADVHIEGFGAPKLFAIQVPLDKAPPMGDVIPRLHALYVLEPLQSTLARPAPVELPNPKGLAVGARVDIFQLDYLKGVLVPAAKGHVRDDGKIVSDDGSGVTELTWIGFAPSGA